MNMYTKPDYRHRGIAYKTLDMLVKASRERGIDQITLEATDMGRPLYEKYGFVQMEQEILYKQLDADDDECPMDQSEETWKEIEANANIAFLM